MTDNALNADDLQWGNSEFIKKMTNAAVSFRKECADAILNLEFAPMKKWCTDTWFGDGIFSMMNARSTVTGESINCSHIKFDTSQDQENLRKARNNGASSYDTSPMDLPAEPIRLLTGGDGELKNCSSFNNLNTLSQTHEAGQIAMCATPTSGQHNAVEQVTDDWDRVLDIHGSEEPISDGLKEREKLENELLGDD